MATLSLGIYPVQKYSLGNTSKLLHTHGFNCCIIMDDRMMIGLNTEEFIDSLNNILYR